PNEKRSQIAPKRDRSFGQSSKNTDRARNELLQGLVAAEAQFPLRCGLLFSKSRSARNIGRPQRKQTQTARERARNSDRVGSPECKAARQSCNPPAAYRDSWRFGSHASKKRTRRRFASAWWWPVLFHPR